MNSTDGTVDFLVQFLAGISMLIGLLSLWRLKAWRTLFVLALVLANLAVYALILPTSGHGGRYQALLMPFIYPLLALGLLAATRDVLGSLKISSRNIEWAGGLVVGAMALLGFGSIVTWSHITHDGIEHINDTHIRMANWIRGNLPEDAVVASFDIGGIGRFSERRIVDLGGLTDPAFVPHLYDGTTAAYLNDRGIKWLVLPVNPALDESSPFDFAMRLAMRDSKYFSKKEIVRFEGDRNLWRTTVLATAHAYPAQVLYQLTWTRPVEVK